MRNQLETVSLLDMLMPQIEVYKATEVKPKRSYSNLAKQLGFIMACSVQANPVTGLSILSSFNQPMKNPPQGETSNERR